MMKDLNLLCGPWRYDIEYYALKTGDSKLSITHNHGRTTHAACSNIRWVIKYTAEYVSGYCKWKLDSFWFICSLCATPYRITLNRNWLSCSTFISLKILQILKIFRFAPYVPIYLSWQRFESLEIINKSS